jgi:hypothetical protein
MQGGGVHGGAAKWAGEIESETEGIVLSIW